MSEIIDLLKNSRIFSSLKTEELETIAMYSEFVDYENEEVIFTAGSLDQSMYIVNKGSVRITEAIHDQKEMDIAKFIPGELFGELDLFEEVPRSAMAIADEETTLLVFPKRGSKFNAIIDKYPEIFAQILDDLIAVIAHRIRETNKLVSEKTQWIEELRSQILYDKLTGMYNKSYLTEEFPSLLGQCKGSTAFLYVKPDNFKAVNDSYGHTAGDGALLLLAQAVKAHLGENGIGVRHRGNEFVVIFPHITEDEAVKNAEKIRQAVYDIDLKEFTKGEDFHLTGSVGISLFPVHSRDTNTLVEDAFNTLLELQKAGGNRVGVKAGSV